MRMSFWRELKWYIAVKLLGWTLALIWREADTQTMLQFNILLAGLNPDPIYGRVPRTRKA